MRVITSLTYAHSCSEQTQHLLILDFKEGREDALFREINLSRISSALKSKQNQRSTGLHPLRDAFTKINLSSEEDRKKDSFANFDDRSAERLNEQEGNCRNSSETLGHYPAQFFKLFLLAASVPTGAPGKASEPARSRNWLMTS